MVIDDNYDKKTRFNLSGGIPNNSYFKRTVKHYLFDQVRTSFLNITADEMAIAIFLTSRKISERATLLMAIFRTGKRVGLFDIRTGISRGDLANSAYHKTDSDPRLSRKGKYRETYYRSFASNDG